MATMTPEQFKASNPALYKAIYNGGKEAGVQAENARIKAIDGIRAPGYEALIAEHRMDPTMTKDRLSGIVMEAQAARLENRGTAVRTDAEILAAQAARPGSPAEEGPTAEHLAHINEGAKALNHNPRRKAAL